MAGKGKTGFIDTQMIKECLPPPGKDAVMSCIISSMFTSYISLSLYIYIYIYIHVCMYIYIYIYREREMFSVIDVRASCQAVVGVPS